jgi:Fe2+ or Zn2+ uptake regulation protein
MMMGGSSERLRIFDAHHHAHIWCRRALKLLDQVHDDREQKVVRGVSKRVRHLYIYMYICTYV